MILWGILGLLVAAVFYVAWGIAKVGRPTKGPKIASEARPNTALVVIDIQQDFTGSQTWPDPDIAACMDAIRAHAASARSQGHKVIAVRQVFDGIAATTLNGIFNKGRGNRTSPGLDLDPRLEVVPDITIDKSRGDAFSSDRFDAFLEEHGIGQLVLTGLDGCFCVNATAHGALNRGYAVTLKENAILAGDQAKWIDVKRQLQDRGASMQ